MTAPIRIAMWSGPRNISTAMMYAFASRKDCAVSDEPFYAAYLAATGARHPLRDEILAAGECDADIVAKALLGPVPRGRPIWYQKHMPHHMVGLPSDWMLECRNAFLIRHPARVVASYARKREGPSLDDIGFHQQAEFFDRISDHTGHAPPVLDSADIRENPEACLGALCAALGIPFDPAMLHWPAGGNQADGIWAKHWYGAVHRTTGFDGAEGPLPVLQGKYADLVEKALPAYEKLAAHRLKP